MNITIHVCSLVLLNLVAYAFIVARMGDSLNTSEINLLKNVIFGADIWDKEI